MKVSIIIPVLNEEKYLAQHLKQLQKFRQQGHEIILVDGGSEDNSYQLAINLVDTIVRSKAGRACQMNTGASKATHTVLMFLHADTALPNHALQVLLDKVKNNKIKHFFWGRFDVRLSGKKIIFRVIATMMNLRSRLTFIATGDQAIFVSKQLFEKVSGFADIAIMEDIELCRRLKKISKPLCLRTKVTTSSRRWQQKGIVKTIFLMWKLRCYYFFGVAPNKLKKLYR